ncbi:hypothetical protein K435DRAFT_427972 [Dendrothele bispora CBS 962.96]|uniref:Uncharacterized protein n=1 Tax=Dendrothele bispora (strain CBS 962.96) TaxID=1314807 RepID=A0A4S8L4D8_DENBC|nr:hypothetical protein K435DRAFT_427972 [Dendrothele bispora CBS 962.96]
MYLSLPISSPAYVLSFAVRFFMPPLGSIPLLSAYRYFSFHLRIITIFVSLIISREPRSRPTEGRVVRGAVHLRTEQYLL